MKKLLIVYTVLLIAVPITAGDFDVYGKIGMAGWWMKSYRFYHDSTGKIIDTIIDTTVVPLDTTIDTTIVWDEDSIPMNTNIINPIGKLGIKFKGDRFGSCIELGFRMNTHDTKMYGNPSTLTNYQKRSHFFYLRLWYLEWYINDYFTFLVGQDYAPTCFHETSNQAFNGYTCLCNVGCLYTDRYPMFKLSIHDPDKIVEGKLAVIRPDTSVVQYLNTSGPDTYYHCETKMPKFEAGFSVNIEGDFMSHTANFAGGFARYSSVAHHEEINARDAQLDINSWVVGGDLTYKVGIVKLSYDMFFGQNIGTYGVWVGDAFGWWRIADFMKPFYPVDVPIYEYIGGIPVFKGDSICDGKAAEMALIINVKPWDFLAFECGGGTVIGSHEYEDYEARWDKTYAWYVQSVLTLFEHLNITPEVGQYWWGPHRGFGRYTYWGLNTLIDF